MTSSEIKTTLSYTADNESKPYVEGTAKSYPTIEEEHSSGEMGKTEPVPEDGVAQPKKAAKIHDFCFGIPYGECFVLLEFLIILCLVSERHEVKVNLVHAPSFCYAC